MLSTNTLFSIKIFAVSALILLLFIFLTPQVHAFVQGGALNATFITRCTCGPGYLTYMKGVPGTRSGIYYFGPMTRYWVGSGRPVAWDLMFYTPKAGICMMVIGPKCKPFKYNLVNWYGGGR